MPDFDLASNACSKVSSRGCELESCDGASKGEVIYGDSTGKVCKNSTAVFVYGEEKVTARVESETSNVLSMGKGERP